MRYWFIYEHNGIQNKINTIISTCEIKNITANFL